jgi:uncharacterized protein
MAMNSQDRQAIEQLFTRLEEVEQQSPPRDPEAERFIQQRMARQPGSAYYMAQSIVALEQALNDTNQRLEEVERQGSRGSLMPKSFDPYQDEGEVAQPQPPGRGSVPIVGPAGAYRQQQAEGAGGGFLAGAFQTALGVTGGMLLGNAIGSIFGSGKAQAAESRREEPQQNENHDDDDEDGNEDDGGGGFLDSIFGGDDEG